MQISIVLSLMRRNHDNSQNAYSHTEQKGDIYLFLSQSKAKKDIEYATHPCCKTSQPAHLVSNLDSLLLSLISLRHRWWWGYR
jgi:hypothetical protein